MRTRMAAGPLVIVLAAMTVGSGVAAAQSSMPAAPIATAIANATIPLDQAGPRKGRRQAVWIGTGIAVGAGVGAAAAYWAADRYGDNEGGRFCTRCFVTWGAFTIPAGAAAGALIGKLTSHAVRPQRRPLDPRAAVTPLIGRRSGAVVMSFRY